VSILDIFLVAVVFVGCVYWLTLAIGVIRVVRNVPVLAESDPPPPKPWPKLSVVVAAANEAKTIEPALKTVLAQDHPELEIIVVNDRSTDETGAIVDRLAAGDDRVQAVHITELPNGWLGKVHALKCGADRATGQWLLFADADVHLGDGALRRAVAFAEDRGWDHLAAAPDMWSTGLLQDIAVSMFLRTFCVVIRCWAVTDPRSKAFVGVGAFNLVRRSAFYRTDGFEWLRLEVADDMGLGMMLKRSGARSGMVNATGLVGLHWYPSVGDMARGVEKGYASISQCSLARMILICVVSSLLELAPLVALLPVRLDGLWPASLVMGAAAVLSTVALARWANRRIWPGLLFPIGAVFSAALLLRAGWLGWRRGGIMWRGTLYPSKMLREGRRVRFP